MASSRCQELGGRVPHACERPGLATKPAHSSWPQQRDPVLPLCELSLPMAELLAQAEATVVFVQVHLKHLMVLAGFQGIYDRRPQMGCTMWQSKPIKHQQKEASSKILLNTYAVEKGQP